MKNVLKKITKIISNIIFWILVAIMVVLAFYMVVIKVLEKQGKIAEVPINFYTILSQSMYPTIKAGDIIITYQNENDIYQIGDIVTFVSNNPATNGVTITHRIVEITNTNGEYFYKTKGDANNTADYSEIPSESVVGKCVFTIPKAGFIQQFLVSRFGWIVAILLPSLGIIIYDIIKIIKKISLKELKSTRKKDNKLLINQEAKETLTNVIENNQPSIEVQTQIKSAYDDMGIENKKTEESIESLFDEEKGEEDDETEIL